MTSRNIRRLFDLERVRLPSGLEFLMREVRTSPLVSLSYWVGAGSVNDPQGKEGLSHFLEHLIFKGGERLRGGEADRIIESLGGISNAGTTNQFTHYYVTVPRENRLRALRVLTDLVFHPGFQEREIEKERQVVFEELRQGEDDWDNWLFNKLLPEMYRNSPLKNPIIGTYKSLRRIDRNDLIRYHRRFYLPRNSILIATGGIDGGEMIDFLSSSRTGFKPATASNGNGVLPAKLKEERVKPEFTIRTYKKDVNLAYFILSFLAPPFASRFYPAVEVLSHVLSGNDVALLDEELVRRRKLLDAISIGVEFNRPQDIFYLRGETGDPDSLPKALTVLWRLLTKKAVSFSENGVLQGAKSAILSRTLYLGESIEGLGETIGFYRYLGLSGEGIIRYHNRLRILTPEHIRRAARRIFHPSNRINLSVLYPKDVNRQVQRRELEKFAERAELPLHRRGG